LIENKIDLMAYKLCELTYDDIKVVDSDIDKVLGSFDMEKSDYQDMRI